MKIQCSFCSKKEASVFCTADEAPLCDVCDRQVHHANKLAGKHNRFSLLSPSTSDHCFPASCDICQENRAIVFCKEDRAIVCRECDVSIHKVNEHTRKHCRFLLTGLILSASASHYPSQSSSDLIISPKPSPSKPSSKTPTSSVSASTVFNPTHQITKTSPPPPPPPPASSAANQSISEYLMETLPGWRVDDFLDPSSPSTDQFPDHGVGTHLSSFPYDDFALWVPQDTHTSHFNHLPLHISQTGVANGLKPSDDSNPLKLNRKRFDDGFTVPEITSLPPKKSRNLR